MIWSTVEQGLAVAAGCFATLGQIYRKIASKITFQGAQRSQLGSEDAMGGNLGGRGQDSNGGSEEMLAYPKDAPH